MANKTAQEADAADRASYRTGPNVDNGLEPGAVTVDPETAHGRAAARTREANGAKTTMTEEGVEEVRPKDATYAGEDPKVADATHVADGKPVDKVSAAAKKRNPNTIANDTDDIVADPKADVQ